MKKIIVENDNIRLDIYLSNKLNISRSKAANFEILVNGKKVKNSYRVKENDIIEYKETEEEIKAKPENIKLDIIYEDDDIIVVNKPNGMVVHPAIGSPNHTLVNALMFHSNQLSNINGEFRPGIVHRIDAYTTGLLMIAKNDNAHLKLAEQLSNKTTYRKYVAIVWGRINNDTGTIDAPIGRDLNDRKKMAVVADGKKAITHFKVLKRFKNATLIELRLETGRTHQIRVHMNYIGYPIVNDPVYGKRKIIDNTGQCLHAKELGFNHPKTNKYMQFDSELPECFLNILNKFEKEEL